MIIFYNIMAIILIFYSILFAAVIVIRLVENSFEDERRLHSTLYISYKQAKLWGWYKFLYIYLYNLASGNDYDKTYYPVVDATIKFEIEHLRNKSDGITINDKNDFSLKTYRIECYDGKFRVKKLTDRYSSWSYVVFSPWTAQLIFKTLREIEKSSLKSSEKTKRNDLL